MRWRTARGGRPWPRFAGMAQSYAFDVEGQVRGRGTGCLRSETRHADTLGEIHPRVKPPLLENSPPMPPFLKGNMANRSKSSEHGLKQTDKSSKHGCA